MAELRLASGEQRDGLSDWLVRGSVALPFLIVGLEKFGSNPHWVRMFGEIGWGVWFRYAAGVAEVLGAVLVLMPRVAVVGFGLLACTMAAAVVIVAVVLRSPAGSLFPAVWLGAVCGVGVWWVRRSRAGLRKAFSRCVLRTARRSPPSKLAGGPGPSAERERVCDAAFMARLKPCRVG